MNQSNFKKILILKHGSLGDIVFSLEPILAIRQNFINSKIDLVTEDKFIKFFQKMKIFSFYFVDNRKSLIKTFLIIIKIIIGKYDLIIDLQNSKRTNVYNFFFKLFSKAKINGSRNFSHNRYFIPSQGTESPTEGLFNQLKLINIKKIYPKFDWLNEDIKDLQITNQKIVMVIPGTSKSNQQKKWPSNNFRDLSLFLDLRGYKICLVGTKQDEESFSPILKSCNNTINLIDKSPPEIIYSVACKSKLIIANDTGPGHIASLSNVNVLWLALNNQITKSNLSYNKKGYLLLKNSMDSLTVDEVINFISKKKLLDKV